MYIDFSCKPVAIKLSEEETCQNIETVNEPLLCPHCDLLILLPVLGSGEKADCPRCETTVTRQWADPKRGIIGYAFSALLMLILALSFPFISIQVSGIFSQITLFNIPQAMLADRYISIAVLLIFLVQFIPAFCMLAILLICSEIPFPLRLKKELIKIIFILKSWCMVEIFLVGVLVSFVKLMSYGDINIGQSFVPYCVFCLLQVRAFQRLDPYWLWGEIESAPVFPDIEINPGKSGLKQGLRSCQCCMAILPADCKLCPRCTTKGQARRQHSLQWSLALLITSIMLYIPANMLPIMTTVALGDNIDSTILSGVLLLWNEGSYPVAIVIFIASIMIPSLKIITIGWLCFFASVTKKKDNDSKKMHLLYDVVEFVGRWSMIDIFVIAVLGALLRIGKLMAVYPAIGSLFFTSVVILTMLSAIMYDPRLIWDRIP